MSSFFEALHPFENKNFSRHFLTSRTQGGNGPRPVCFIENQHLSGHLLRPPRWSQRLVPSEPLEPTLHARRQSDLSEIQIRPPEEPQWPLRPRYGGTSFTWHASPLPSLTLPAVRPHGSHAEQPTDSSDPPHTAPPPGFTVLEGASSPALSGKLADFLGTQFCHLCRKCSLQCQVC